MKMQADELEKQLADEIGRARYGLKRFHDKLVINIDDRISFDSVPRSSKGDTPGTRENYQDSRRFPGV
jgi:hypothetical protein